MSERGKTIKACEVSPGDTIQIDGETIRVVFADNVDGMRWITPWGAGEERRVQIKVGPGRHVRRLP